MHDPDKIFALAKRKENENMKFFARLRAKKVRDLDGVVHELHEHAFSEINCLDCANCCKSLGPRLTKPDIERISKSLKMTTAKMIETYLKIDEDGDYVFRKMPCTFLLPGNYCSVYEVRPKACREYPHTDRRKFHQILTLTLKNSFICPVAFRIIERLKTIYRV